MKVKIVLAASLFASLITKAQISNIHEDFSNFSFGSGPNSWSYKVPSPTTGFPLVSPGIYSNNGPVLKFNAGNNGTESSYLFTPQIVARTENKILSFEASISGTNNGAGGTLEIGMVNDPLDLSTFNKIGSSVVINNNDHQMTNFNFNIPPSGNAYIVFKFTPNSRYSVIQIDNIFYNHSSLGVSEQNKDSSDTKFYVNSKNTTLEFITKKAPLNYSIYSAVGQRVADGQLKSQSIDISYLKAGTYFIKLKFKNNIVTKSKFIKK